MPPPQRKILTHTPPAWVQSGAVFFLTLCAVPRGKNHLCREDIASILFEAVSFRQKRLDWYAHLFLFMPDHAHALVSFPLDLEQKKVIANFKEMTAKRTGVAWQRDYFDHRLRRDESFDEKAHYIRMNPVRAGLVHKPEDWPYVWTPDGAPGGRALPVSSSAK